MIRVKLTARRRAGYGYISRAVTTHERSTHGNRGGAAEGGPGHWTVDVFEGIFGVRVYSVRASYVVRYLTSSLLECHQCSILLSLRMVLECSRAPDVGHSECRTCHSVV